ncbi:MAG: 50S ribosomal protein L6 [Clostridia bacterium]
MSRIGRLPVAIPAGVTVTVDKENIVTVKGPLGELKQFVNKNMTVAVEGNEVLVSRPNDDKEFKSMHGLYRTLVSNMVVGVTKGYSKTLIINGVGYKVTKQGSKIVLGIGYSHLVEVEQPAGITFEVNGTNEIVVKGISKDAVGQCAANIKAFKVPDPYHAYGIRYSDEVIARKEGKKAGK